MITLEQMGAAWGVFKDDTLIFRTVTRADAEKLGSLMSVLGTTLVDPSSSEFMKHWERITIQLAQVITPAKGGSYARQLCF